MGVRLPGIRHCLSGGERTPGPEHRLPGYEFKDRNKASGASRRTEGAVRLTSREVTPGQPAAEPRRIDSRPNRLMTLKGTRITLTGSAKNTFLMLFTYGFLCESTRKEFCFRCWNDACRRVMWNTETSLFKKTKDNRLEF